MTGRKDVNLEHGNLANRPVPRMVIVFENAIGYLPDEARPEWRRLAARGDWEGAARLFVLDHVMLRRIAWLTFQRDLSIDVVTYCGPGEFARALADIFDEENIPVRMTYSSTPERMARRTSFEADISAVYDANPGHALVYGKKGVVLTHHTQLGG